ncbi:MAG: radical SAM protein [Cyclobacteriaceae bacterium]|nr:radical SAM protein [Cyclobacteriaceae bacterium]
MISTLENTQQETERKISPDFVRISAASAMALRLRSGRFSREFDFGGINILLNYDNGCLSDCSYCGLARTRPGAYEEKSFIRVEWPLVDTDELIDRMAEHENKLTRLCISMVTHGSAYKDTVEITRKLREKVKTPLSLLVAPPTLNTERLQTFKDMGVDMIGVGLDAITPETFRKHRTDVPNGSLRWDNYWHIINESRRIFGPWKVNIHTVVGLGETDKEMIDMFYHLKENQILPYLFSFNPEAESRLADWDKAEIKRWRRIQLVKHLIETYDLPKEALTYHEDGSIKKLNAPDNSVANVLSTLDHGTPFMTNGCPNEAGTDVGCTRPYGSYRPSEPFRDYPFQPETGDMAEIRAELALEEIIN